MSLYGGIKLTGKTKLGDNKAAAPATPAAPAAALASTPADPAPADDNKPKPAAWSAALRFAPTVRKKPASAAPKPSAAALKSVFGAADADDDDSPSAPAAGGAYVAVKGKASLLAQPVKAPPKSKWGAGSSQAGVAEAIKPFAPSASANAAPSPAAAVIKPRTRARRVIAVPPAMTLEHEPAPQGAPTEAGDVNGFRASEAGKKAAALEKKRNKKGKKKARDDPALAFADVPYDPARPCDYAAYKTHIKLLRAQRKLEREEEEKQRREREGTAGSASSYYSEDEREKEAEERASKKPRFFAPPSSYDTSAPSASTSSFAGGIPPPASYDAPSAPSRDETGDEAYARRLALSSAGPSAAPPSFRPAAPPSFQPPGAGLGASSAHLATLSASAPAFQPSASAPAFQPAAASAATRDESGEEAYARRIAMSQRTEETGEEAYQRRLALSRGAPPPPAPAPAGRVIPPPPPPFIPPSAAHVPPPPGMYPPPPAFAPPSFGDAPPPPPGWQPPPAFAPASSSLPASYEPVASQQAAPVQASTPSAAVDAAQAKAREIAARLSKLGGAFAPPSAPVGVPVGELPTGGVGTGAASAAAAEPDHRPFAERLMSKYGWESGKGLGADESGMTSALSVQKGPVAPSAKKGKNKKKDDAPAPAQPQGMAARSVVVDASRAQRQEEQKQQMGGEASRVVLLQNLCGVDDLDDELPGEVAEEAGKFGVVDRCAVRVVPGAKEDEAVRIFLVMSGIAGGYNAVRNFDGRFFGGRTVKAKFYDEAAFHRGQHDL
ncbi:hypothetical protein JCM10213_003094 [Rhodosporidiobolus nylandii]